MSEQPLGGSAYVEYTLYDLRKPGAREALTRAQLTVRITDQLRLVVEEVNSMATALGELAATIQELDERIRRADEDEVSA